MVTWGKGLKRYEELKKIMNSKRSFAFLGLFFFIVACGGGGDGGSVLLPVPEAPQNVIVSSANSQVTLSWAKVEGATTYRIYWSTEKGATPQTGTMISNVSSPYDHIGLTNGITYYYVVTAMNQHGESAPASEANATPSLASPPLPPATVATSASNRKVNIGWSASQSSEEVTSYNIYWSQNRGVTKTSGIKITNVSNPHVHANLINDTTYYYIVTAINKYGEGNPSQEVSATATRGNIPLAPTGIVAAAGNYSATIAWNPATGAAAYNIYWSKTSDVSSQTGTKIAEAQSPYIHAGLDEDATYYYVVTAVNGYGESDDSAMASVTIVNSRQDIFVAMGDSITIGYPLSDYNDSYVPRLARLWGKTGVNEGADGARSAYGTSLIRPLLAQHNPRYLTIYYGTNDVGFYDTDQIVLNLRFVIDRAKENGTIPVVATVAGFFNDWSWRNASARELNRKIRALAAELGIACADLESALGWNSGYFYNDGLHPNSAGHQIIANTFYTALTR
jgi:lysophospholipase L1-like esterase